MNKLWYKKQAGLWNEALPIGNGHTGVMIYGGRKNETLCFNDVTLWSGYPQDQNNPKSLERLEKVLKKELTFYEKEFILPHRQFHIVLSEGCRKKACKYVCRRSNTLRCLK